MSGLTYIGPRSDESDRILEVSEVQSLDDNIPTYSQIESEVRSELSNVAPKSYVDSVRSEYATPSDVNSARTELVDATEIGTTVARLSSGVFPSSYFSKVDAQKAQFFTATKLGNKNFVHQYGWGSVELMSMDVSNYYSNRYIILAWGRAETKPVKTVESSGGVCIEYSLNGEKLSWGASPIGYNRNWSTIVALPNVAPRICSGTTRLYMSAVNGGGKGDNEYSIHERILSAITIPVT